MSKSVWPVRRVNQQGMSLIEVLVSLLIFSIGLLGMVGLQARATQYSVDAENRSRAALLANEAVSQMWVSNTTALSASVISSWQSRVSSAATGLPNGLGAVSAADSNGVVTVTITWKAPSKSSSDASNSYVTKVVGPAAP